MIVAGQSVGNYRILSKIGTGGMGAVYLAEHPQIGKKVAFKVIHRELAGNRDVVSRFFQEAKAVNRIGSEHIVEIHDFGVTPEGDHYYIMEYLEGRTLASVLSRESAIDVQRAMHVAAQIAAALEAAHANGVIHRDLKPDNIMLTQRHGDADFVKVLDFGLAKVFQAGTGVQTALGVLLGTPQYMSPESCEGKSQLDGRTDIYALGVLMFQMMTGVLPFDGDSMGEILVKQVTMLPPAPRGLNPHIPPSVEQIVLRCLAKQPDARFSSMGELRDALRDPDGYLRRSPQIAPARSVAPGAAGVDAKQVLAYAAAKANADARTMIGPPAISAVPAAAGPPRAGDLPALAQPAAPKNHTMRIETPVGFVSRPAKPVWPYVMVIGILLGLGSGITAVVLFGGPQRGAAAAAGSAGEEVQPVGSARPAAMAAAMSGSAVAASGSAVAASGSAASGSAVAASGSAVAASGSAVAASGSAVAASGSAVAASGSAVAASGSGSAVAASGSGSAAAAPATARLSLDSNPPGAQVYGPDHALLGKAPLDLAWPVSPDPVVFELRLAGYKKRTKELAITGNTVIRVELDKLPPQQAQPPPSAPHRPRPGSASTTIGDGLVKPGDL